MTDLTLPNVDVLRLALSEQLPAAEVEIHQGPTTWVTARSRRTFVSLACASDGRVGVTIERRPDGFRSASLAGYGEPASVWLGSAGDAIAFLREHLRSGGRSLQK